MTKRIFSLLVALCLIVGLLPAVAVPHAHAEEGGALTTPYALIMGGDTSSSYTTYTLNNYDTPIYTKNTTKTDGYFNKGAVTGTYIGQSKSGANKDNYNAKLIWHSGEDCPTLYLRNCIMDNYDEDNKYWRQRSSSNTTVKQYPALYTGSTAPLKIVLEEGKSELKVYSGIHYQNDLTIESVGDASLTLWTQINGIIPNSANKAASALNVTGKKLTLNANLTVSVGGRNGSVLNHVILARGADMVIDGGNIVTEYRPTSKANMSGIGVLTSGNLVINGGSVSAKAYNADNTAGAAYLVEFGNITITDGKVEAYSELQSGLRAKNIYISGGEVITDTNHGGLVVTAESGEISVTGGTFKGFTRGGADYPFAYNGASAQAVKIPVLGEGATIMAGDDEETAELVEDLDTFAYTKHYMFVAFEEAEEPTCEHTNTTTTEVVTKDATCTEAGSKTVTVTCADCDEVISEETVVIDPLGHTEEIIPGTAADCDSTGLTEGKKCSVCGETLVAQEEIPALGHTEEIIPGTAADCDSTGLTEGKKCSVCGETLVAQEIIEALGHTEAEAVVENFVDSDLNNKGSYDSVVYCSVCNEELSRQTIVIDEKEGATAEANGVKYYTLAEAIAAGGEVKLLTDVVLEDTLTIAAGKTVILNLDGWTISQVKTCTGNYSMIINNGDLTITGNGEIVFTDTGAGDPNYGWGSYTLSNNGVLTVKNGTIKNATAKMSHAYYTIQNGGNGTVVIDGGTIINETSYAIRQFASGNSVNSVTINGGEVIGTRAVWMQAAGSNAANAPTIALTVNGGKLTGTGETGYKLAVYAYNYGDSVKNVSITVTGGEIDGDIALTGGKNKADAETVTVTGGTITNLYSYAADEVAGKTISVSGGTFAVAIDEVYCAEGFIPTANEDGTFGVKEGKFVAEVNGTKFETLAEAVAAANTDDTIVLLASVEGNGVVIDKSITIDFGGNTYTIVGQKADGLVGSAGTETLGFQILKNNTVTLTNGTLATGTDECKMLIQNYANLTLKDITVDGTGSANMQYVLSNNSGEVALTGATNITAPEGAVAFDVCKYSTYAEPNVTVNTTGTITGKIEVTGGALNLEAATIEGELAYTAGTVTKAETVTLTAPEGFCWNAENVLGAHGYDAVVTNPTCTEAGFTIYTCAHCGDSYVADNVAALGHTEEEIPAVDATCTETGLTAGTKCSVCGEILTAQEEIPALGHSYTDSHDTSCDICGEGRDVPVITVDGTKVNVEAGANTLKQLHVFYVGDKTVADIENWSALTGAAANIAGSPYGAGGFKSYTGEAQINAITLPEAGNYVLRLEYVNAEGETLRMSDVFTVAAVAKPGATVFGHKVTVNAGEGNTVTKVWAFYLGEETVADNTNWNQLVAAGQKNPTAFGAIGYKTYQGQYLDNIILPEAGNYVLRVEYVDANGETQYMSETVTVQATAKPGATLSGNKVTLNAGEGNTVDKVWVFCVNDVDVADINNWNQLVAAGQQNPGVYGTIGYKTYEGRYLHSIVLPVNGEYILRVQYSDGTVAKLMSIEVTM